MVIEQTEQDKTCSIQPKADKMRYPYILYNPHIEHAPIFQYLSGDPYVLNLSDNNSAVTEVDFSDQPAFQKWLEKRMGNRYTWGVADYLEPRKLLLKNCPQMVAENRFFHLGLDIIVPLGTTLYAPLEGIVRQVGYEEGNGNYGGNVLLEHDLEGTDRFYSLYGHLSTGSLPAVGTGLSAGDAFAQIGDFHENGNWFYHTHLQVITETGIRRGFVAKGYCAPEDLAEMQTLCPSPIPLFKR